MGLAGWPFARKIPLILLPLGSVSIRELAERSRLQVQPACSRKSSFSFVHVCEHPDRSGSAQHHPVCKHGAVCIANAIALDELALWCSGLRRGL